VKMRLLFTDILCIMLLTISTACNSDIFVEPLPKDIETDITLSPGGDSYSFKIKKKGLSGLSFGNEIDSYTSTIYYDKDGEILYGSYSIDDVAKIVYAAPRFSIEFRVSGDKVEASALDNTYDSEISVWSTLLYGEQSLSITFHLTPGKPMEIEHLGYDIVRPVAGFKTLKMMSSKVNNNTDSVKRIGIYPYNYAKSKILLQPEELWQNGIRGTVPVQIYSNGEWIESESSNVEVTIGDVIEFHSENVNPDEVAYIDVPAHSTVTSILYVRYATLDVRYLATFMQPNSQFTYPASGKCQLFQPIDYDIEISCEN